MADWRYSINYGPDGEENYAFVYDGLGALVGNLRTHHAIAVVNAMNAATRPSSEALQQAREEWRDIASAPRDGTWILAIRAGFVPETCFWDGEEWCFDEGQDPGTHYHPDHWMPLPPGPDGREYERQEACE